MMEQPGTFDQYQPVVPCYGTYVFVYKILKIGIIYILKLESLTTNHNGKDIFKTDATQGGTRGNSADAEYFQ